MSTSITVSILEMLDFIKESMGKYKSNSSKKAFITRSVNQQQVWINELKSAVNQHEGWLLGVKYTNRDIYWEVTLLVEIKKLYNTIK